MNRIIEITLYAEARNVVIDNVNVGDGEILKKRHRIILHEASFNGDKRADYENRLLETVQSIIEEMLEMGGL
jgi:hypothetical protein